MAEEVVEEAVEETVVPDWIKSEDADVVSVLSKFESQDDFYTAAGLSAPEAKEVDWREGLPDDLKKTADRFTSKDDAIRSIVAFQKRESQVRVPGKDATDEEMAAYQKAVGVPDKPEGYEFPELLEGELTEEVKASREVWASRFHALKVPQEAARALTDAFNEDVVAQKTAEIAADKAFAEQQESALRDEWKGEDYETNIRLANRAFEAAADRAGIPFADLKNLKTKDDRLLMDNALMLKMLAVFGREGSEGSLGPVLNDGERETMQEQLVELRAQSEKASADGNSKLANKFYQKALALQEKISGSQPIVGAAGRTV